MVVEEAANTNVNASKEEHHIGTTAKEGATPVNTEEREQAAIEADEITSSIKTGEGKTAHDAADREAFAPVVRAQEEGFANGTAAENTAIDDDGKVQASNLHSAFTLQNSGYRSARNLAAQWRSRSVRWSESSSLQSFQIPVDSQSAPCGCERARFRI